MKEIKKSVYFSIGATLVILSLQFPGIAEARDSTQRYSIAEAMKTGTAQSLSGVGFYFHGQPHATVERHIGTFTTRRTTNAFNKSDYASCQWAFLSALKTLYERALKEGGNAVVNIQSVTTGQAFKSDKEFVCRAGNVISKVYLQGDVVFL